MKRFLCYCMTLFLCLSLVPAAAFAGDNYSNFNATETYPNLVEFQWDNSGTVTAICPPGTYEEISGENCTKIRMTGTSIVFMISPAAENSIDAIRIEQEASGENEEGFVDLTNDNRYNGGTPTTFTLDFSDAKYNDPDAPGYKFVFINFDFTGGDPENEPGGSEDGQENEPGGSDDDQDAFDCFGYNGSEEFQVATNISGSGEILFDKEEDRGRLLLGDSQAKYNYSIENLPLTVTFAAVQGETLDLLVIGTQNYTADPQGEDADLSSLWNEAEGVYAYTVTEDMLKEEVPGTDPVEYRYKDIYFEAHFSGGSSDSGDDPADDPNENPGDDPQSGGLDLDELKAALENYIFAYCGADDPDEQADQMKTAMAKELSERRIGSRNAIGTDAYAFGEIFGLTAGAIKDCITFSAVTAEEDSILGIPYYSYEIGIADTDPETEGSQPFLAAGQVYVLNSDRDIVFAAEDLEEEGGIDYAIITLPEEASGMVYVYAPGAFEVYGNAAMLNGIYSEDNGVSAYHVTQEHAGLEEDETTFPAGTRLVVSSSLHLVHLGHSGSAAAWDFSNSNSYAPGTAARPADADVFYGAAQLTVSSVEFANVTGGTDVEGMEVLNLSEDAVGADGNTLYFHTNYDNIAVKINFSDDTAGYLNIHRVGLFIDSMETVTEPDSGHCGENLQAQINAYESTWGAGTKTFAVWHGTDQSVRYEADSDADRYITATFYYDDEGIIDNRGGNDEAAWLAFDEDVATSHSAIDHVSLFVTVTYRSGRVERRVISAEDAITRSEGAVAVDNGGFTRDLGNACGYAGQGSCHLYDDFVLWQGSDADYEKIASVSAIVYTENEDTFGGVCVGSGAGVEWDNK